MKSQSCMKACGFMYCCAVFLTRLIWWYTYVESEKIKLGEIFGWSPLYELPVTFINYPSLRTTVYYVPSFILYFPQGSMAHVRDGEVSHHKINYSIPNILSPCSACGLTLLPPFSTKHYQSEM